MRGLVEITAVAREPRLRVYPGPQAAGYGSRTRRPDSHARLHHHAEAEAFVEPAWATIPIGADPPIRRSVGGSADGARGERATEASAPVRGMHEHLADLASTVVRLDLSEADRATLLDRRYHPHVSEFGHRSRLRVERLRLGVLPEVLAMPK